MGRAFLITNDECACVRPGAPRCDDCPVAIEQACAKCQLSLASCRCDSWPCLFCKRKGCLRTMSSCPEMLGLFQALREYMREQREYDANFGDDWRDEDDQDHGDDDDRDDASIAD